jgi:hypothetical protein
VDLLDEPLGDGQRGEALKTDVHGPDVVDDLPDVTTEVAPRFGIEG